jgi:hypothetical protein
LFLKDNTGANSILCHGIRIWYFCIYPPCANTCVHVRNCYIMVSATMVRLQFSLDEFKEEIISRYYRREQYGKIAPDYKVSRRTLERRIQAWGIQKRAVKRKSSSNLLGNPDIWIFISICWNRNLTNKKIQYIYNF